MARKNWTEDELLQLLIVYCELPFGKMHSKNKDIISLSEKIGRTPSAVALKMVNFASLDPTIDAKGMSNASKLDREIWDKFFNNIDYYIDNPIQEGTNNGFAESDQQPYIEDGSYFSDYSTIIGKTRIGQQKFRRIILASYQDTCAISGISDKRILVASHIAPWAADENRRLDPRNGICLNPLWDKVFDKGLISLSDSFDILYSNSIEDHNRKKLIAMAGKFRLPEKFKPDRDLIAAHREKFGFPG